MSVMRPAMREAMCEAIAGASAPGRFTLVNQALAILRRFGSDAHVYLPGATQTNYGVELATVTTTTSNGSATVSTTVATGLSATSTYRVSASLDVAVGYFQWRRNDGSNTGNKSTDGDYSEIITGTTLITSMWLSGNSGTTTNISVREVITTSVVLSGLQAANYLDSVGTTLATVDSPVGLVLDAAGSVGVDTWLDTSVSTGGGWGQAGSVWTATAAAAFVGIYKPIYTTGKTYAVTFTIVSVSAGSVSAGDFVVAANYLSTPGTYTVYVKVTSGNAVGIQPGGAGFTGVVSNISVREVTGIHATQATTAAKPRLERGVRNLLTYSQDFTNAAWAKAAISPSGGFPDPFGGTLASKFIPDVTNTIHETRITTGPSAIASTPNTYCLAVKDSGCGFAYIQINEVGTVKASFVAIDLTAGSLGSTQVLVAGLTVVSSVAPMGGGWHLVAINSTTTATVTGIQMYFGPCNSLTDRNFTGDGTKAIFVYRVGLFQGTLTAQQILAEGGIPLTTTAAASNPSAGKYSWAFDGGDSLSLGSVPFQMSDDHFVIGAINPNNTSAQVLYSQNGLTNPRLQLYVVSNSARCDWQDDAAVSSGPSVAGSVPVGTMAIVSMRKIGNVKGVSVNGGADTTNSTVVGTTTFLTAKIGINSVNAVDANYANGSMGPVLVGKGTLSDSEYLTLKRLVANLTPNAPSF